MQALLDSANNLLLDSAHYYEDFNEIIPQLKHDGEVDRPRYVRKVIYLDRYEINKETKVLAVPADLSVPLEDYHHEETKMYY